MMQYERTGVYLLLLVAFSLWASAFVFIRALVAVMHPGGLALYRFTIASLVMLFLYGLKTFKRQPSNLEKLQLCLVGVVGISIYNTFLNMGEVKVSAAVASFFIGMVPIFTTLLSITILGESVSKRTWAGVVLAMLGLSLLFFHSSEDSSLIGEACVFVATLSGALYNVLQKKMLSSLHPLQVISWVIWGGTAVLLIFTPVLLDDFRQMTVNQHLGAIYLGVFPAAIAYLCWSYANQLIDVSKASVGLYSIPIMATALGYLFLNELPSHSQLISGLIALSGALVAFSKRS